MRSHFKNLLDYIPELRSVKILDVGSGKGKFVVEAAKNGSNVIGLEINDDYIKKAYRLASENEARIKIIKGVAEDMPFKDDFFDFINLSEVIEHVNNPSIVISEIYRILKRGGHIYVSVPNRFGAKDPHFKLYFVNFLPRFLSGWYISLFSKHKNYSDLSAGKQKLKDMNYYTFSKSKENFSNCGFDVFDMRELKIRRIFKNKVALFLVLFFYKIIRFFYFDTFHFLLKK